MSDMNQTRLELDTAPSTGRVPTGASLPPAPPGYGVPPPEAHLSDYVRVLYKRRWTATAVFLVVLLGVTVHTFTATPIYQARTRLLIDNENQSVVNFKEVVNESANRPDYYQTQYNILQSRALARKTLDDLQLWTDPRFAGGAPERFSLMRLAMAPVRWVRGLVSSSPPPVSEGQSEDEDDTETVAQSRAISRVLAGLSVTPVRNSRLVDVMYRSTDPRLAARVVNALATAYIDQNLEYRFSATQEATTWLGERLGEQKKQVEVAELALQQYREQNDAISLTERENIVVQKLADVNAALTKAKTERLLKEATWRQLDAIRNNPAALDTFPAVLGNSFIQSLKSQLSELQRQRAQAAEKLGDRHPDMIRLQSAIQDAQFRIDAEVGKVVQAVRTEYQAALAQEQNLIGALDQQKREGLSQNRRAIEYNVLVRDVESGRQVYDALLQRAKETGVSGELRTSNIRVVDRAERPLAPSSPRTALNLASGLFAGVFLALVVVFFFEYIDNRIKTPDEIKAHLGLPSLGLLPALPKSLAQGDHYPLITNGVPPSFGEAFRALRTNILFSSAESGSRSLVVTSSGPGEGKTLVSTNLAVSLAQFSQRVLLIDADMRRPKAHEAFGIAQEPGLSNVLVGNAKASDTVQKTAVSGLWLLPAGHVPPNPAELLGSKRFGEFLRSLGDHFDWVVIDSPPVMAVTDSSVIAHRATGVLFVVGSEMTSRHVASRALDQLESAKAKFVGAVLNRVDLDRNAYYYSHYYRREYANYYTRAEVAAK